MFAVKMGVGIPMMMRINALLSSWRERPSEEGCSKSSFRNAFPFVSTIFVVRMYDTGKSIPVDSSIVRRAGIFLLLLCLSSIAVKWALEQYYLVQIWYKSGTIYCTRLSGIWFWEPIRFPPISYLSRNKIIPFLC